MTKTIDAVYEAGAFRPLHPGDLAALNLTEGTKVMLTVYCGNNFPLHLQGPDPERAAEMVAEIMSLAVETDSTNCASTDHDRILYGGPRGAL